MKVGKKKSGFWTEFRNFAIKGNVRDLAIAVVIGNAFGAIVNSLVADLITPLLGLVTGSTDIKSYSFVLRTGYSSMGSTTPPLTLHYGNFLQTIINFFIVALSIFLVFKLITMARKRIFREGESAVPEHEKPAEERLLEEIRDLLKKSEKKGGEKSDVIQEKVL
jgi:large conductance mechanosensitive channel